METLYVPMPVNDVVLNALVVLNGESPEFYPSRTIARFLREDDGTVNRHCVNAMLDIYGKHGVIETMHHKRYKAGILTRIHLGRN